MPDDLRERLHYMDQQSLIAWIEREYAATVEIMRRKDAEVRDALARIDELEAALAAMTAEAEGFASQLARCGVERHDGMWATDGMLDVYHAMNWLRNRGLFETAGNDGSTYGIYGRFVERENADA